MSLVVESPPQGPLEVGMGTAHKRAFQGGCGFAEVTGSRRPPFKFFAALGLESLASLVFVHVAGTGGEGLSVPDFRILTQESQCLFPPYSSKHSKCWDGSTQQQNGELS